MTPIYLQISDRNGHIVEVNPKNSTVLHIRGNGITSTQLMVVEATSIRCNPMHKAYKIHSGLFESSKIAIHVISFDSQNKKDFLIEKKSIVDKDKHLVDSLTSHPRIIRYLGSYFNFTTLEVSLITDFFAGCTFEVRSCNILIIKFIIVFLEYIFTS